MSKRRKRPADHTHEGSKFDKIVKENLLQFIESLLRIFLGIEVIATRYVEMQRSQVTRELEPDFLCFVKVKGQPEEMLLHLEIESFDRPRSNARFLLYVATDYYKYDKAVMLHVLYLGKKPPRHLTGRVNFVGLDFTYAVHQIRLLSYREFLGSSKPEEVILAILANPEELDGRKLVRMVLARLTELLPDKKALSKFTNQLKILSILRNLQPVVNEEIKAMPLIEEIIRQLKEDEFIKAAIEEGLRKGLEEGHKEGLEEGLKKGLKEGLKEGRLITNIQNLRRLRVKGFDAATITDLLGLKPDFVERYLSQVDRWEEIRAMLRKPRATVNSVSKKLGVEPIVVEAVKLETNGAVE